MKFVVRKPFTPAYLGDLLDKPFNENFGGLHNSLPKTNISESKDNFTIEMSLPGYQKSDLSIVVEENILTVKSDKAEEKKGEDYSRKEFGLNTFERRFKLPKTVDQSNLAASMKNGILTLQLPKLEEAKAKPPRKIEIA